MAILIISLIVLGVVAAIIGLFSHNKEGSSDVINVEIEYFDDEELDAFKGRRSDDYTDEEAEQFREVMYTMRQEEVKDWNRSLILRGVAVPDQLKDELVMLLE